MPHAITTNTRDCDFDAAAVADHTLVFDTLVFATSALVVAHWAEDALAEKTAWLRLECTIVNRFGILDLATGPFANGLWRGDSNADTVE